MAVTNYSGSFSADFGKYIYDKLLALSQLTLVMYQFGDKYVLPPGFGTTALMTRFNRIPLALGPLSEGVPPPGESVSITQVSVQLQQWGDLVRITDIAEITPKHPLFQNSLRLLALNKSELMERNINNDLLALTQVNYVNQRGSRGALLPGDVMNTTEISRAYVILQTAGAIKFDGTEETDITIDAKQGGARASANPRTVPHYVAVCRPEIEGDLRQDSNFVTATTRSDLNRLYNAEFGEWSGIRFCSSNMLPTWTGYAAITGTGGSAGTLATGTYYIIVTASDNQNKFESQIYQVSGAIAVTGPTGSISVTLPANPNFTFSVYVGTSPTTITNWGLSASGPTDGVFAGQAIQLAPSTTVIITGVGSSRTPPAAPATGVTVYPTYVLGRQVYGTTTLQEFKLITLSKADKSDPLNQQLVMGFKFMNGTIITNNNFGIRIESTASTNYVLG